MSVPDIAQRTRSTTGIAHLSTGVCTAQRAKHHRVCYLLQSRARTRHPHRTLAHHTLYQCRTSHSPAHADSRPYRICVPDIAVLDRTSQRSTGAIQYVSSGHGIGQTWKIAASLPGLTFCFPM
eukprot:2328313-Rhodomonas_salina.2